MSEFNFNSTIDFIAEFFSDLPPKAVAIIVGVSFFALMVFCGLSAAFVIGFLALFVTQSGYIVVGTYVLCVAAFSIFGLIKGYQFYKNIMLSYENSQS